MNRIHRGLVFSAVALAAILSVRSALAGAQARIVGNVFGPEKVPIPNAKIVITNKKVPSFKIELAADDKGVFKTIIADATYVYTYLISADGFNSLEIDKKAPIGSETNWEFHLSKAGTPVAELPPGEQAKLAYNEGVGLIGTDPAAAEKKFIAATELDANRIEAWQALAKVARDRKDGPKAVEYARKALALKEKELAGYKASGDEIDETEKVKYMEAVAAGLDLSGDKAGVKAMREEIAKAMGDPTSIYNEAVASFNKGEMKQAEAKLQKALEMKEDYPLAHYLLGMISMNGNKSKEAKLHFNRYLELEPAGEKAEEIKAFLSYLK
jgi:tetratricopeptide (TPR) repeat protein